MNTLLTASAAALYNISVGTLIIVLRPLGGVVRAVGKWQLGARAALPELPAGAAGRPHVWLHAASLGECHLLCRLAVLLARKHPDEYYVATAVTSGGVDYLRGHCPPRTVVAGYLPIDTLGRMRRFVRRFRVSRVWIMETELWPSMLRVCAAERIPVGLFNARLEERSAAGLRRVGWLTRGMVAALDVVLAQDEAYGKRFARIGVAPERIKIMGNFKARVAIEPPDAQLRERMRGLWGLLSGDTVLTAGCVHPGEAPVLLEARRALARQGVACRLILVPRHCEAMPEIMQEAGDEVVLLRRGGQVPADEWQAGIVSQYGVLDELYALADIAFIGGTLVPVGGHSMWDAVRCGVPVLFGPRYHTQQRSGDELISAGVACMVTDGASCAACAARLLGAGRAAFAEARQRFAASLLHSQDDLLDLLA